MQIKAINPWIWVITVLAAAIISSCDYPQAGYYALVGLNHTGEQVAFHPFLVEEITDDSNMTTDFMLLIPRFETLIEAQIFNSQDTSYRNWSFGLATGDSLAGSFDLALAHFKNQMKFYGEYQAYPSVEPWPVAGVVAFDERSTWLEFNSGLPYLHESLSDVFSLELAHISEAEFEAALGCSVADAQRVAQVPVSLEIVEQAITKPKAPKPPLNPSKPPSRNTVRGR